MDPKFLAIMAAFAVVVLSFEIKRKKATAFRLVVVPAIAFIVTLAWIKEEFFSSIETTVFLSIVFGIGLYFGIARGKLKKMERDKSGEIVVQGTLLYVAFWFFVFVLKISTLNLLSRSLSVSSSLLVSLLLLFAIGSLVGMNYELLKKYFATKKEAVLPSGKEGNESP